MRRNVRCEILDVRFAVFAATSEHCTEVLGRARVGSFKSHFTMTIVPRPDGEWAVRNIRWNRSSVPTELESDDLAKELVNRAARLLDTINMWPAEQVSAGARVSINQRVIPAEHADRTIVSSRHNLLSLRNTAWPQLWERIERRLQYDPYFEVVGFDRATVRAALPYLKQVFSGEWVKARYRQAGLVELGSALDPQDEGFSPAYHLARTALGAICRDPGWNYLVEIGLALSRLEEVDGVQRLRDQLARSPGAQHHICLAAEMKKRGHLLGLEPFSGSGAARCDLLLSQNARTYQVELKEFSSRNPLQKLRTELNAKTRKLPESPNFPIVFHVVFRETGADDVQIEQRFFKEVSQIVDEMPPKISAVVTGRRFVDSRGGPVKRDSDSVIFNDRSIIPAVEDDLRNLFRPNYDRAEMPYYGLASFVVFGPRPDRNPTVDRPAD